MFKANKMIFMVLIQASLIMAACSVEEPIPFNFFIDAGSGQNKDFAEAACGPKTCVCEGGEEGIQTCRKDGSGWNSCKCGHADDSDESFGVDESFGSDGSDDSNFDSAIDVSTDFDTGKIVDTDDVGFDTSTSTNVEDGTGEANPSSGCGASFWPNSGEYKIRVNGTQREYMVSIPDTYDQTKPHRLVFVWHYSGGSASQVVRNGYLGLKGLSDSNTIFVAGQGLISTERIAGWDNIGGSDIAFAKQLFEHLDSTYCIDENRVFSAGWDSGGTMSNDVGCRLGNIFRAIASISGSGPSTTMFNRTNCTGNTAAWIAQGIGNNNVSSVAYANGLESRDYWKDANNCGDGKDDVWPGSCVAYRNCLDGYPVHWCTYWGDYQVPDFAAQGIWGFFSQF